MSGKQVKRQRRKARRQRLDIVCWLAKQCFPDSPCKQIEAAQQLWEFTDAQLTKFTGDLVFMGQTLAQAKKEASNATL